jgi:arsenite methyltransferase
VTVDPRQLWRAIERRGLGGTAALALSIVACYGTLAAVATLSALGVRTHGSAAPLAPAFAGGALIGYAMFGHYDRVLELAGFALLAAAVFWDFRLRSRAKRESPGRR